MDIADANTTLLSSTSATRSQRFRLIWHMLNTMNMMFSIKKHAPT